MAKQMLVVLGTLCLVAGSVLLTPDDAAAQSSISAPNYGGSDMSGSNGPAADGRPGQYFFDLGVQASKKKDYVHAIEMYKVASSWAYKPAEYNLAVMYLRGEGTPVDLPRALAWMALAAERSDPRYVKARDLINAHLNDAQFKQANVIMAQLLPTYGDKVALTRAEARWREVRASATGSRVGSAAGHLEVGGVAGATSYMQSPNYDVHGGGHVSTNPAEVAGVRQTDGVIAYQQLRESNNPYDPKFEDHRVTGTVTVEPLVPVRKGDLGKPAPSASASSPSESSH